MRNMRGKEVLQDIAFLILSIALAAVLAGEAAFAEVFRGYEVAAAVFAGALFSSAFTTAPAIVLLVRLGALMNPLAVAAAGALGTVLADLLLFYFVKERLGRDASYLVGASHFRRLRTFLKISWVRWIAASLGALVIASPLPDELGVLLIGVSRVRAVVFVPISYTFNFLGIYLLARLGAGN